MIWDLIGEWIWKTAAVTLAVWILTVCLRRRSAAMRHALWMWGIGSFILIPALSPMARRASAVRLAISLPSTFEALPAGLVTAPPPAGGSRHGLPQGGLPFIWGNWIWAAGVLMLGIRRGRAAMHMRRIAMRSKPAPAWLESEYGVHISDEIRTPLTFGLFRPLILLPPGALDWPRELLQSVLAHEEEHIRRFDPLSHWLAELVCAAWWFHPFAWLARGRAAHERECACDDAVLRSGVRPGDYASELLNLAVTLPKKGEPVMALSALSDFERRIRNLLTPDTDRRAASMRMRLGVALSTVVLIVPLALLRAQAPVGLGDLSGTVTDPTGAVVPNALVTASGSTGNREITRSDAVGEWRFAGIPAGNYTVEVRAAGFAAGNSTIALAVGQKATVSQVLALGRVSETINVKAQGQARQAADQKSTTPQRIRVGGMVQATNLIRQVRPAYPDTAKAQGIEGTVLLSAVISKEGNLLSLAVMNKLADPDLAAAALDAVKQWQYRPTLLNGEPVEVVTTITVNFTLEN